jgi:putative endonuclease
VFLRRRKLLSDRARLGRWGEKRAERFLRGKCLKTLDRNVVYQTGELDLVMVDCDGMLVFVEVKTRADERFAPAEAAISPGKKRRLVRAGRYFLACHDLQERPFRFDVVTVILRGSGRPEIRHYENAFTP